MAEGFAKKTGGEDYVIFSAGSSPLGGYSAVDLRL